MKPIKFAAAISISEEALMHSWGPDARKGHNVRHTPPTDADWQQHREAVILMAEYKALMERMEANPCIYRDYDDGSPTVVEPKVRSEWEWTETRDEWRERIGLNGD